MTEGILVLVSFIPITLFGFLLINFFHQGNWVEKTGLGFLVGIGIFTFLQFLLNISIGFSFAFPLSSYLLITCLILIIVLNYFANREIPKLRINIKSISFMDKILLFSVGMILFSNFVANFYWPVKDWDAIVLYDFRAKIFANTGSMQEAINQGYFVGYPLLTSLAHTWIYSFGLVSPMPFYSLFLLGFVLVLYSCLCRMFSKTKSFFIILLILIAPQVYEQSTFAYTNFPYTVYLILSILYLILWSKERKNGDLLVSAILTGLTTWTRSTEPFWLVNLGLLFLFCCWIVISDWRVQKNKNIMKSLKDNRKLITGLVFFFAIFFSIQLPWKIFSAKIGATYALNPINQVTQGVQIISQQLDTDIFFKVADYIFRFTILPIWWLFAIFVLAMVYQFLNKRENFFSLLIVLSYLSLLFVGTLFFAIVFPAWEEIHGSLERLSMFFAPLLILYIGIVLFAKE